MKLTIVTPEKTLLQEDGLDSLTLPTLEGEITILPNHLPLVTQLASGELTYRRGGKAFLLAVTGGFFKLTRSGEITILADYAVRSEEIELAKVKEAKEAAERAMKEKKSARDFVIAEAELRKTLLEMKIAQKRKYQSSPSSSD